MSLMLLKQKLNGSDNMPAFMEKFIKSIKEWKLDKKKVQHRKRIGGFYMFFYQEEDKSYTVRTKMIKQELKADTCYKLFKKAIKKLDKLSEQEFLSLLKYGSLESK